MLRPVPFLTLLLACIPSARPVLPAAEPPPLIVISIDGFRWDFLDRPPAVRLRALAVRGARIDRLIPPFPTKTFPSHYTIVTGLYPDHHGIVANAMVDPAIERPFIPSDTLAVSDPRWWGGEPIWVTAIRQGRRAATMFWPGSEAAIGGIRPTYWRRFDARLPNTDRFAQLLAWLDLPPDSAPHLLTLYLNELDFVAHKTGPRSAETDSALGRVDRALGAFLDSLRTRRLDHRVNLLILSDHGLTDSPTDQMIYLDDYFDLASAEIHDWGPVAAIAPRPDRTEAVLHRLQGAHPKLAVYRKAEVPSRFRFGSHPRIAPIVAIAAEGWTITTRTRRPATDLGNHGYDPALESMAALLIGVGPGFRPGSRIASAESVHLYELMARLLGLVPAPNDGRLDSVRALLASPAVSPASAAYR
jgi:predicted AlkP superfamily pyrophosphatase or phosphodiesterase